MYKALLHLYPASFRKEYGTELSALFEQQRHRTSGLAVVWLWLTTLLDVAANAAAVHWDVLRQDLRFTWRTLRRSTGFALTVIAVTALGIGANTAAFSIADFVLVRPLPYADADRLVKLWERMPGYSQMELSPLNYRDWRAAATSFEGMAAFNNIAVNMIGQGEPARIEGITANAELFGLLGVHPLLGRAFTPEEDREEARGTVVLSYGFWQRQFGGEASVLGRRLILDDQPFEVIGVMPAGFNFPTREAEFWIPLRLSASSFDDRNNNYLKVLAKLKKGVTLEQARSEMAVITAQLEKQYPKENKNSSANVLRLRDELTQQSRMLLLALCGAAGCVLLIACANVANLLMTRALVRQKELAVRAALGAGRERLVRQMLTESLVLAGIGGLCGVLIALAAVPLFARLVPNNLPVGQAPSLDFRMLIVAGLLTTISGLVFGVLPALRISRDTNFNGLREGSRAGGGRKERVRSVLVLAEVAASVVLLVASGLLLRAMWKVQSVDPGFRSEGILTLRTALPWPKYEQTAKRSAFYERVLSEVRQVPGVTNASYISFLPMVMRGGIWPVSITGESDEVKRTASSSASLRFVTPDFFKTMGIPMHAGRDVSETDTADRPFVAVVSESFAKRHWPNQDAIGRRFKVAFNERVVIGVVGDVRVRGLERASEPQVYVAYKQVPDSSLIFYGPKDLVVQSSAPMSTVIPAVRDVIRRVDPDQPISSVRTMSEILEGETTARSVQVRVLAGFATVAFVLAGIGIYGLLSFAVSQRANEIGVRIALGAQSRDIFRMVLRRAVLLAIAGLVPGVALAYVAGRSLEALLAGVTPRDPATFATAATVCFAMTLLGGVLPAFRAARVDPITVMRSE